MARAPHARGLVIRLPLPRSLAQADLLRDHLPLVIFESKLGCHDWAASVLSTSTARRRIWDGDSQLCASGRARYQGRATPR